MCVLNMRLRRHTDAKRETTLNVIISHAKSETTLNVIIPHTKRETAVSRHP